MIFRPLNKLFRSKYLEIDIKKLPSQGYFYPEGLEIYLNRGDDDDQINYHEGVVNSNIFGIIDTVKKILQGKIEFNIDYEFDSIKAIDVFFIFIEFVKFTNKKDITFNNITFSSENFVYFDFDQFINNYDKESREFVFDEWRYSLPSIGIETSLSKFSYEVSITGKTNQYKDCNYNMIYFLGKKNTLSFADMVNLIEIFEDLDERDQEIINSTVDKFMKTGIYFLMEEGKQSTRINPNMLKQIWDV